jgi:hypothetical protein
MAWRDNGLRDLFNRIRTCHEEWSNDGQKIHCDNYQFGHCDAFQFGGLGLGAGPSSASHRRLPPRRPEVSYSRLMPTGERIKAARISASKFVICWPILFAHEFAQARQGLFGVAVPARDHESST